MAKVLTMQSAFNRGELDPALFGRNDWQTYFSGAKKLRNMICRTQGGVVKRAGTEFITHALEQDKPSTFIRFRFSVEQTYLLEFSNYRFRVLKDGGVLLYPDSHAKAGQEVIVDSPYSSDEMQRVRTAQTEDTMIFTHPDHRPRTLKRVGNHHTWEFKYMDFGVSVPAPDGLAFNQDGKNDLEYRVSAIAANNEESLPSGILRCGKTSGTPLPVYNFAGFTIRECYSYWVNTCGKLWPSEYDFFNNSIRWVAESYLERYCGCHTEMTNDGGPNMYYKVFGPDGSVYFDRTNSSAWRSIAEYYANAGYGDVLAKMRATIESHVTANNNNAVATGISKLRWNPVAKAVRYRVYRSYNLEGNTVFYPIGETAPNETTFTDDKRIYISTEQPQTSQQVFVGENNYPGVCLFYQQRLLFARTNKQPNTVWGSRVGAYQNFNRSGTGTDADGNPTGTIADTSAFEFTLQAEEVNEILWGVSMSDILFGTAGGEFRMSGGGYIVTPTNVNATRQSNYGCSPVQPVVIGQAVMGVGRKGKVLRAYQFEYTGDAYKGKDVSHYAGHLFRRRSIAGVAHQYEPESVLWVVMSDGSLLSCTYMNEEEVLGWSRHDTDGKFEAVVSMVSIDGDDEIWFEVARDVDGRTVRCIERMKTIQEEGDDVAAAWYVDCGLEREGEPTKELAGLDHLEGKRVVCLGDGNVHGDLVVSGGTVTLPVAVRRAVVGLPYTGEIETMELEPMDGSLVGPNNKRPALASVLFYHSRECLYGHPSKPNEMKFRAGEKTGDPIVPKTIRKNVSWPAPPSGSSAGIWLASPSPVPFGVLSLAVALSVGDATPHPGKALS